MLVLDLGCGMRKTLGAIGADRLPFDGVDVLCDLERFPYPFADHVADAVVMNHVVEHVDDPVAALREVGRILKPGGRLAIRTPHFSSVNAFSDFTHKHYCSLLAFRLLIQESPTTVAAVGVTGSPAFRLRHAGLLFWPLHDAWPWFVPARVFGIEWLANRHPVFYERFLAFLFPAMEIEVEYEAIGTSNSR